MQFTCLHCPAALTALSLILANGDHELFRLLGAHAATALQGALLRQRAPTALDGVTDEEAASLR